MGFETNTTKRCLTLRGFCGGGAGYFHMSFINCYYYCTSVTGRSNGTKGYGYSMLE